MNSKIFKDQAQEFFMALKEKMDVARIRLDKHWSIDHLCFRVSSEASYQKCKTDFSVFANLLGESEVNGRLICTFKLLEPLRFLERTINLVELPAPKPNKTIAEGFEHIEVVCDLTFPEIISRFSESQFDQKGLAKDFNCELALKLDDLTIKFHQLSLESVVSLENHKEVFSALQQSNVLKLFRENSPLIAGTIPLDLTRPDSDLDILMSTDDLDKTLFELKDSFGSHDDYISYRSNDLDIEYGVVSFTFHNIPFEIYLENTVTVRQRGYQHFQVEERLLKLGGHDFKEKVRNLRLKGFKTEPAFAKALSLSGDPYLALLALHHYSEDELTQLFLSVPED